MRVLEYLRNVLQPYNHLVTLDRPSETDVIVYIRTERNDRSIEWEEDRDKLTNEIIILIKQYPNLLAKVNEGWDNFRRVTTYNGSITPAVKQNTLNFVVTDLSYVTPLHLFEQQQELKALNETLHKLVLNLNVEVKNIMQPTILQLKGLQQMLMEKNGVYDEFSVIIC